MRHPVAVKVLRSSSPMESELRLRFEREMRLCSALSSMHVPHVYDVGELPSGLPYIVMERLVGATLADWLGAHRRLPVAVVVEIGIQLCAALTALHQRNVVHRDVKPENLVLHRAFDQGYIVKLVDFGICKPLVERGPGLTQVGTVVGTPEYMSPEQVQGIDVDVRTDVYSAGVVLYELLAGRTPFEGPNLDAIGRAILFASPPRLSAIRHEVSAVLEGIVMRAMARDRSDRPPSIGALGQELTRFADEHALRRHPQVWSLLPKGRTSRPPPPPPEDARPRRLTVETLIPLRLPVRRAGVVGTAFVGLAVLIGAVASVGWYVYEPMVAGVLRGDECEVNPPPEPIAPPAQRLDIRPLLGRSEARVGASEPAAVVEPPAAVVEPPDPRPEPAPRSPSARGRERAPVRGGA